MSDNENTFEAGALLTTFEPQAPASVIEALLEIEHAEKIDRQEREMLTELEIDDLNDDNGRLLPTEPTPDEIAAVLQEIDPSMETATHAGVVDHESQYASWSPPEAIADAIEARELEEAVQEATGEFTLPDLDKLRSQVPAPDVERMVWRVANALDERERFEIDAAEAEKGDVNPNILRTIKKVRSQMVTKRAASLLCAIAVTPEFINRSINEGFRYNVYALGKLGDVIYGVTDGQIANAINLACMRTLFSFRRAGLTFDMEVAKGCCSKQYAMKKLGAAVRQHVISHTVSESTAPTQASSTMQALVTLGVVTRQESGKNPSWTLTDTPITKKLAEMFEMAA